MFARNEPGSLYGANLIPEWTEDRVTFVAIYWNVSTWSPYQVVFDAQPHQQVACS